MAADLLGEGARIILWQIDRGTYAPGNTFPGPAALEYQLELPTPAVRHAVRTLLECGVLRPGPPLTVAHPHRWRIQMPKADAGAERVARYILGRIHSGEYPGGTPLPPVSELTTLFRATRPAVQDALRLLAAREIVTGYPPRVGRPLLPPRRLKFALAREAQSEDRGAAGRRERRGAALLELQVLLAASALPDRESMSRTDAVEQWLRTQIGNGTYLPDSRLPTGPVLAAALGVQCHVVDVARKRLVDEGLLRTDGMRGTRVCGPSSSPAPSSVCGGVGPGESVTRQAEGRIRELLADYGPGERLPSHRTLAKSLGVAHSTIREALQPLRRDGLVEARSRGYFTTAARGRAEPCGGRTVSTGRADPARAVHGPPADSPG